MTEQPLGSASAPLSLPGAPNMEWLRTQARRRLAELRRASPDAKLAAAQFDLARQYGFPSWRALKAHVDSLTVDANVREKGDDTHAMHWAAAAGHFDVVRRLADAGGDVVGHGDDHELEVIGWATCWDGCDDAAHRAIASFLVSRGARHHIFSAIAMNLADDVRRIVAADGAALSRPMSRDENMQQPLHFAVRVNRPEMVALLLDLGADPLAADGFGEPPAVYAASPRVDRQVIELLARRGGLVF